MEMDNTGTQQVWQRVLQRQEPELRSGLRELLLEAGELAGSYRYLVGVLTGSQRELAKVLYIGQLEILDCLKGVSLLQHQGEEVLRLWKPEKIPARKLLESCYHRTRRCMVEYTARSAEPELGVVFQKLAEQAGRHCVLLARLLGIL